MITKNRSGEEELPKDDDRTSEEKWIEFRAFVATVLRADPEEVKRLEDEEKDREDENERTTGTEPNSGDNKSSL